MGQKQFRIRVYIGRDKDGKKQYINCYGNTQREAEKKALEVRKQLDKGIDITARDDTFQMWAQRFLNAKETEVSQKEWENLKGRIAKFETLYPIPVNKLRAQDFQDILIALAKENPKTHKPTAKRTLKGYKEAAKQVMQQALFNRVIDFNPLDAVVAKGIVPPQKRRALTDEEQQWIIDTPHRARRAAMIMMFSGLRLGELVPLGWNDIDLNKCEIKVNKSVEYPKNAPILKEGGKTENSTRIVNIPRILVDFLRNEKRKDLQEGKINMLVCPDSRGKMYTKSGWRALWESYLMDLNIQYGHSVRNNGAPVTSKYIREKVVLTIPPFTAHWLRHTFATMLYLAGVNVEVAKEQLGHSDIKTTLNIYTHLDKIYKIKNMNKLDDYISRRQAEN